VILAHSKEDFLDCVMIIRSLQSLA
jgi:hypothetical protein